MEQVRRLNENVGFTQIQYLACYQSRQVILTLVRSALTIELILDQSIQARCELIIKTYDKLHEIRLDLLLVD